MELKLSMMLKLDLLHKLLENSISIMMNCILTQLDMKSDVREKLEEP
jgi:hypothetical protein